MTQEKPIVASAEEVRVEQREQWEWVLCFKRVEVGRG
jgi:hypothetical protein